MLILLIVINLVFCGVGVWAGYRIAQAQHEAEIEELKKTPVNVKYVHSNLVPVTVQRVLSEFQIKALHEGGIFSVERAIVPLMKRDLGEALWPYATIEISERKPDNAMVCTASILVRTNSEGVKP